MYKNIAKKEKLELKSLVDYQDGQVVSKTLVQNDYVSVTIWSMNSNSTWDDILDVAPAEEVKSNIKNVFILNEGETIVMPKDVPHAVFGEEKFKMELVVSF